VSLEESSTTGIGSLPIVVTTVLEKKRDWPKLQLGSPETLLAADTPLLLALTTSWMSSSRALSGTTKELCQQTEKKDPTALHYFSHW